MEIIIGEKELILDWMNGALQFHINKEDWLKIKDATEQLGWK